MGNRTNRGTFKPGHSGNPGGRPKIAADVKALAMTFTEEAVKTLAAIMRNEKAPLMARAAAANSILDRAIGRPESALSAKIETTQPTEEFDASQLTDAEFAQLQELHNKIAVKKPPQDGQSSPWQ